MKPDTNIKGHRSNAGVGIKMSIDESATAHIMDVLTKLYANPLLAVVREYSTNAADSHVQAGVDEPIRVALPTQMRPVLIIEDYGVGLSESDIENIYSRYGTSTKRDSNEAVGMLGLGCKSALSYTDQFTLVGRKDGVATTVLVSRDEDGAGSMTVVDVSNTPERDGATVQVAIKADDVAACHLEAARFFMFWPEGSVLMDDGSGFREPDKVDGMWLDEHTLLTEDEAIGQDLIVMGNVPYPLVDGVEPLYGVAHGTRRRIVNGRYQYGPKYKAVVFVPIGTVNFAPSRETLMDTRKTRATLDKVRQHIAANLEQRVREDIADAPDAKEAQNRLERGKELVPQSVDLSDAQWNGRTVLLTLERQKPVDPNLAYPAYPPNFYPDDAPVEDALKYSYLFLSDGRGHRKSGERATQISLRRESESYIIEGFDGKHWTNVKRAKLELFFSRKGWLNAYNQLPRIIAVDKLTPDERFWLDGWKIVKWEKIAAVELPKTTTQDGKQKRIAGSYDCLWLGERKDGVEAAKIATASEPVYWIHGNYWNAAHHSSLKGKALDPKSCIVVCLGANRIDKFKRDFPKSLNLNDAAKDAAERWWKQQSEDTKKAYALKRHNNVDYLKGIGPDRLDDADLREVVRLANLDVNAFTQSLNKHSRHLNPEADKTREWAEQIIGKYPLLHAIGYNRPDREHLVLYLNAAHRAGKGA